jgi:hypothetical protein
VYRNFCSQIQTRNPRSRDSEADVDLHEEKKNWYMQLSKRDSDRVSKERIRELLKDLQPKPGSSISPSVKIKEEKGEGSGRLGHKNHMRSHEDVKMERVRLQSLTGFRMLPCTSSTHNHMKTWVGHGIANSRVPMGDLIIILVYPGRDLTPCLTCQRSKQWKEESACGYSV